jgi:HEPN domain-containing protein
MKAGAAKMDERVKRWLNSADYDLETARAMLLTKRYVYVGFMCHQTIEKAAKAVITRDLSNDEIPPKIHNLLRLFAICNLYDKMTSEQQEFLYVLNPLNIEARYSDYKTTIEQSLNATICQQLIHNTEELLCWIKQQL